MNQDKRYGSCNVGSALSVGVNEIPSTPVSMIPAEKINAMQEMAKKLHKKYPGMKAQRISRKVAEHFKIKLT